MHTGDDALTRVSWKLRACTKLVWKQHSSSARRMRSMSRSTSLRGAASRPWALSWLGLLGPGVYLKDVRVRRCRAVCAWTLCQAGLGIGVWVCFGLACGWYAPSGAESGVPHAL